MRDFEVLRDLHRVVEAQTETLFASTRGCLLVGRQHRERDLSPGELGANEGDACPTVRCTGHGASRRQHPHYNSHTLAFARHHTTGRSTPRSPLASEQMETSSDPVSASLGMERNFRVSRVVRFCCGFSWPKSSPIAPGHSSNPSHPCFFSSRTTMADRQDDLEGEATRMRPCLPCGGHATGTRVIKPFLSTT